MDRRAIEEGVRSQHAAPPTQPVVNGNQTKAKWRPSRPGLGRRWPYRRFAREREAVAAGLTSVTVRARKPPL